MKTTATASDAHEQEGSWEAYALDCEARALIEDAAGTGSGFVFRRKAEEALRAAEASRLTVQTGKHHCVCCLAPKIQNGRHV